jgi:hypothetical protein
MTKVCIADVCVQSVLCNKCTICAEPSSSHSESPSPPPLALRVSFALHELRPVTVASSRCLKKHALVSSQSVQMLFSWSCAQMETHPQSLHLLVSHGADSPGHSLVQITPS